MYKNLLSLISASGLAQLISIFALIVLTRVYDPSAYDLLAVTLSFVAILSIIFSLRLEVRIPVFSDQKQADEYIKLATINVFFFTLVSFLIFAFYSIALEYSFLFLFILIGTIFQALQNILTMVLTRDERFTLLNYLRISQPILIIALGLTLSTIESDYALVFSYSVSSILFVITLIIILRKQKNFYVSVFRDNKNNQKFIYSTLTEGLSFTGATQIPIIIIGLLTTSAVGFFFLANRIISAPVLLIGNSMATIFQSSLKKVTKKSDVLNLSKTFFLRSNLLGIPIALAVFFFSDIIVEIMFGVGWESTAYYLKLMTIWLFFQLASLPIMGIFHKLNRSSHLARIHFLGLLIRVLPCFLSVFLFDLDALIVYIISSTLFYIGVWLNLLFNLYEAK